MRNCPSGELWGVVLGNCPSKIRPGPDLDLSGPSISQNINYYGSDHTEVRNKWILRIWGSGQRPPPGCPACILVLLFVVNLLQLFLTRWCMTKDKLH